MKKLIVLSLNLVTASSCYAMDLGGLTEFPYYLTPPASPESSEQECARLVTVRAIEAYKLLQDRTAELKDLFRQEDTVKIIEKADQIITSLRPLLCVLKYGKKEEFKMFLSATKQLDLATQRLRDYTHNSFVLSNNFAKCFGQLCFILTDKASKLALLEDNELPKLVLKNIKEAEKAKAGKDPIKRKLCV